MFYAILDTERLLVSGRFLGESATTSPAGDALAFRFPAIPRYGPTELREATDRVGLGWFAAEATRQGAAETGWKLWQVYPDLVAQSAGRGPQEPVVHTVTTPLEWSPEGRRVAFVDESEAGFFVVVVTVPGGEANKPQVTRFPVPEAWETQAGSTQPEWKVEGLTWKHDGEHLQVKTRAGTLDFEIPPVPAVSKKASLEGREAFGMFLLAYREAARLLRKGVQDVVFPEGCVPPGLPFAGEAGEPAARAPG